MKLEKFVALKESHLGSSEKKLLKLKGKRKTIALLLLDPTKSNDEELKKAIQQVFGDWENESQTGAKRFLELLPKRLQNKGKQLLHYITKYFKIDPETDCILYPDNSLGSAVLDLLKFFLTPKNLFSTQPFDAQKVAQIFLENKVPGSCFASGKHPQEILKQESSREKKWMTF